MYVKARPAALWERVGPIWRAAIEQAWAAYAADTTPVGAVVVDASGTIVARGRNRIFDVAVAGQIGASRLAHAEVNALLGLAGSSLDPRSLALYATAEPCPLCVGAIVMANVREIHYAGREPFAGSVAILEATAYLRSKRIVVVPPHDADLEGVLKAIGLEFHLRRNGPRVAELVARSLAIRPDAVALAEWLHAAGAWGRLRGMSAREGIAELLERLDLSAESA
jgi:tRNA(adenine34) deaminase